MVAHHVRSRVGMRHHPLAELLNGFAGAGLAIEYLVIEYVAEPGDRPIPVVLAVRARKSAALPQAGLAGPG